jgi:tellurite resistance protein TerC
MPQRRLPEKRRDVEVRVEVTAVGWVLTIGVIVALLAVDLVLGTARPHTVGFKEATAWSVFYIVVAVLFGLVFAAQVGWGYGAEYFAGYVVEKSLSVDNLFVFVIIMSAFSVPREHQQRVLTFGIVVALILRAAFITLGRRVAVAFLFHVPDLRVAAAVDGGAALPSPRRGP